MLKQVKIDKNVASIIYVKSVKNIQWKTIKIHCMLKQVKIEKKVASTKI